MKYLTSIQKNKILKVRNSLLQFKKDFKELKDRETKISKKLEKLFTRPINTSVEDMDKF